MQKRTIKKLTGASVDSILLTLIQLLTYGTNMISTKIVSVSLSLADYGTYSAANLVLSVVVSFTLFGMGDCLNYYYNNQSVCQDEDKRIKYVNTIYLVQCIVGVAAGVVLIFASGAISNYFDNPALQMLMYLICLRPLFQNVTHLYQVLFVSCGKSRVIAVRNLILALVRILTVWWSIYVLRDVRMYFVLNLIIDLVQLVLFGTLYGKSRFFINIFKGSVRKIPDILSYSIPMGIYAVTNTVMREVDKLIVGGLSTSDDLAIYTNCSKLLPLNILVTSFATVLIPHIMRLVSQRQRAQAAELFKNYITIGYLSIWMFSGAILITAREMVPFLYADAYLPGLPVFCLYLIDTMLQFASMHLIVTANGDSKYLMKLSIVLLLINTVLNVGLYYFFSIWGMSIIGPAIATVLVTAVYNVMILKKSVRILKEKVVNVLPFKDMLRYGIQLLATGIAFYFLKTSLLQLGIDRFIAMILICVGYCAVNTWICRKQYLSAFKLINGFKLGPNNET